MSEVRARLAAWGPAALWAIVIFVMSTDAFSDAHTRSVLEPVLRFFTPSLSHEAVTIVHEVVRKLAHVAEYLVFAVLLDRGFRRDSPLSAPSAPWAALLVAALYSLSDEGHQAFVASRGASFLDCGVDSFGAAVGALLKSRARW